MAASAEELTVLATIRDEMSAGLAKIGAEVEALSKKVDSQATRLTRNTKATGGYSKALNSASLTAQNFAKVTSGPLSSGLTKTGGALDKLSKTKAVGVLSALGSAGSTLSSKLDLHSKLSTLSSDLEGVAGKVTKLTAGFALASMGLAAFGLKSVATLQQTQIGLDSMTGSNAVGNALMAGIKADTGIFSTATLGQSAVSMLNQDTPSSVIPKRLSALQNISAVQTDPTSSLASLVAGINSIQHTGRITSEGLDSLATAGVPGYSILSQDTGFSKLQVKQMVDQNLFPAQSFLNQIDNLSGPTLSKFKDGMKRDQQTIGGMFDTLKNKVTLDLATAATPLAKSLSKEMPQISKLVQSVVGTVAPFGAKLLGSIVGPLAKELPTAMKKMQPLLPSLENGFSKFSAAVMKLLPSLVQLGADFAPILPAMVAMATLVVRALSPLLKLINSNSVLRDTFAGLLLSLLAFNKLSGTVRTIQAFAGAITVLAKKLGILSEAEKTEGKARLTEAGEDDVAAKGGGGGVLGKALRVGKGGAGAAAGEEAGAGLLGGLAAPLALTAGAGLAWYSIDQMTAAARKKGLTNKATGQVFGQNSATNVTGQKNKEKTLGGYGATGLQDSQNSALTPSWAVSLSAQAAKKAGGTIPAKGPAGSNKDTGGDAPQIIGNQTIHVYPTPGMNPSDVADAVAKKSRESFRRGSKSTTRTQTTLAMGNTGRSGGG